MRLIWKKRFGFLVVSYPVEKSIVDSPFRIGIYDDNGDMWGFSDDESKNETVLELAACRGWIDLLTDFASRQEFLPNGANVLENQTDMDNEIKVTQIRLQELDYELRLSNGPSGSAGDAGEGGEGGEESSEIPVSPEGSEELQKEEEILSSGPEEDGSDGGANDSGRSDECDPPSESSRSKSLDSKQGKQAPTKQSKA